MEKDRAILTTADWNRKSYIIYRVLIFLNDLEWPQTQIWKARHHWHSNSSSVCSRRHCLRDCHRTRLSDSSLLFVRFEVSVYYYYYYYYYHCPCTELQLTLGSHCDTIQQHDQPATNITALLHRQQTIRQSVSQGHEPERERRGETSRGRTTAERGVSVTTRPAAWQTAETLVPTHPPGNHKTTRHRHSKMHTSSATTRWTPAQVRYEVLMPNRQSFKEASTHTTLFSNLVVVVSGMQL